MESVRHFRSSHFDTPKKITLSSQAFCTPPRFSPRRSALRNSMFVGMPNQSTPISSNRLANNQSSDTTYHCARKSLDTLEIRLSEVHERRNSQQKRSEPMNIDRESTKTTFLEAEVEKLQWQLELMENNRDLYYSFMEEVIPFLQKCSTELNSPQHKDKSASNSSESSFDRSSNPSKEKINLSEELAKSSPEEIHRKFSEYFNNRSSKTAPASPSSSDRMAKMASSLLRKARNLVNAREPGLTTVQCEQDFEKKCQDFSGGPRSSIQTESLFMTPSKKRRNSGYLNNISDGLARLSLSFRKSKKVKETPTSTEDEGIGGSTGCLAQNVFENKSLKPTVTFQNIPKGEKSTKGIKSILKIRSP